MSMKRKVHYYIEIQMSWKSKTVLKNWTNYVYYIRLSMKARVINEGF